MSVDEQPSSRPEETQFRALAEQLKAPLIQIANEAELAQNGPHASIEALVQIRQTTTQTLKFIDAYLLSRQQQALALESVSIAAVLYDAAEMLRPMARLQGCDVEIHVDGRYGPAMAHREGLQTALVTIGQALLQADSSPRPVLTMALYKTPSGLATGIFGTASELEAKALRRALSNAESFFGQKNMSANLGGTGLQIANNIVQRMSSQLLVTRHRKLTGLVAHFQPSAQLQLV